MDKQRLLDRLEIRKQRLLATIEKHRRFILSKHCSLEAENIREWLASKCKGVGLDVCCGYFPSRDDSILVDGDENLVGVDYHIQADELTPFRTDELDYVSTNYFDVFANPLNVLQGWNRALKVGGTIALCCTNADAYDNLEGALTNKKRQMTYTEKPIRHLLARAGFTDIKVEKMYKNLLVVAKKA